MAPNTNFQYWNLIGLLLWAQSITNLEINWNSHFGSWAPWFSQSIFPHDKNSFWNWRRWQFSALKYGVDLIFNFFFIIADYSMYKLFSLNTSLTYKINNFSFNNLKRDCWNQRQNATTFERSAWIFHKNNQFEFPVFQNLYGTISI